MQKIYIYVLVDPFTLKVRYIGRTRSELKTRLCQHISKTKNHLKNKKKLTYKENWINSLLKKNSKPYIRNLCTLYCTWAESHTIERKLINKYKVKRFLVNLDDRGEGSVNKIISLEQRKKMSSIAKEAYRTGKWKKQNTKVVFCFSSDGRLYKKYNTISEAAKELNIHRSSISRNLNGTTKQIKGYRFRESPTELESIEGFKKGIAYSVVLKEKEKELHFHSMLEAARYLNLTFGTSKESFINKIHTVYGLRYKIFINGKQYYGVRKSITVKIYTKDKVVHFSTLQEACDFFGINRKKYGYKKAFQKYISEKTDYLIKFDLPTINTVNSGEL